MTAVSRGPSRSPGLPLIAYANRLPVKRVRGEWKLADGGLVAALLPALGSRASAWVGWDGGVDVPRHVEGIDTDLYPISMSRREADAFYHGFANRTLWPLLHGLVEQTTFERSWWNAYRFVNEKFADASDAREAFRWVHDYHLLLLPEILRRRGLTGPIRLFLHVPFPPLEVFARLPWRARILDGMLGADVVSFHTTRYRDNFLRTCAHVLEGASIVGDTVVLGDGRQVRTHAHPISIDAVGLARRAVAPEVERYLTALRRQFRGKRILLGVDRLDYTKGIPERLRAIELLLELRPELRRSVAFVQIAVPSRGEIREYRELRATVEQLVGRINGRFTEPGQDVPVHFLFHGITQERLLAYYRLADVCVVTPLQDGMNLVAKEYVTAQAAAGTAGVLVLSEFAGAIDELPEALPCNPFDLEGLTGTISLALELDEDDRRRRIAAMAETVRARDVFAWLGDELEPHAPARNRKGLGEAPNGDPPSTTRRPVAQTEQPVKHREGGTMSDSQMIEPRELFLHELGDILYAERTLVKTLPKLEKEATDEELSKGFAAHLEETRQHVTNLEEAFEELGEKVKAEKCPGIEGLVKEHDDFVAKESPSDEILDAFLTGAGTRTEHYEIAAYEGLVSMAEAMGEERVVELLTDNLDQEKRALQKMHSIAERLARDGAATATAR